MESCMNSRRNTPPPIPVEPARERRGARRHRVQMEVVVHPLLDPQRESWGSRLRRGRSRDLTEHGMLVAHTGYLPLGSVVRLFFLLPDGGSVTCHGEVVRHELWGAPRYGIKFFGLSLLDGHRIRSLLG